MALAKSLASSSHIHKHPINDTLLTCAAKYNNKEAIYHLLLTNDNNMIVGYWNPMDKLLEPIIEHANVDLLLRYFDIAGPLSPTTLKLLPFAIETDNLQFVRLLLNNIVLDPSNYTDPQLSMSFKGRHGISVDMLRVLHKEFDMLFPIKPLCESILLHAVSCNQFESVKYLLNNWPSLSNLSSYDLPPSFGQSMRQCCSKSNVPMFELLCQAFPNTKTHYIYSQSFALAVIAAAKKGPLSFVNYYITNHFGKGILDQSLENYMQRELDKIGFGPGLGTGTILLRAAILNNDLTMVELLFDQINDLEDIDFKRHPIRDIVGAIGKPGSFITPEIACKFMDCYSSQEYGCMETMSILFGEFKFQEDHVNPIKKAVKDLITNATSLDPIKMVLNHFDYIRNDPDICLMAMSNKSINVIEYILGLFKLDTTQKHAVIVEAFINDKIVEVMSRQSHHHHHNHSMPPQLPINLQTLIMASNRNNYHSLEYYFNSETFNNMSTLQQSRIIQHVLYKSSYIHVINLCLAKLQTIQQQITRPRWHRHIWRH
ncbi:hypothetical protein SAMD00019534_004080 [Acytostelium subglobosum LB1]|uniref:hypothetical protein n=1 Tax=Acytostelium subglobosum LB1 TaxID=1410327 RepID=UPI00064504CD|nr:hypothetical protein SAMD00019534_004080 [Acytostelium subglobosum LB1]GAM17233.1 hypothetical protein SAMD00019534_004080 [Acytostelium subglobosum LB1]|eukprot:XP_012759295.1 hypothetical protein SAMD00019534_004080 [Acytostelium subglobosum LB1]